MISSANNGLPSAFCVTCLARAYSKSRLNQVATVARREGFQR